VTTQETLQHHATLLEELQRSQADKQRLQATLALAEQDLEALRDRWAAGSPESAAAASRALLDAVAQNHRLAALSRDLQGLPPADASRSAMVRAGERQGARETE
jgi:hypothetical protein